MEKENNKLLKLIENMKNEVDIFRKKLSLTPLIDVIREWVIKFPTFKMPMEKLLEEGIINLYIKNKKFTLSDFKYIAHERAIILLNKNKHFQDDEKVLLEKCYKEFLKYLNKISYNEYLRKEVIDTKVYRISPNAVQSIISLSQYTQFKHELAKINIRDSLIAECIVLGGFRISKIIGLTIDQIDFSKKSICIDGKCFSSIHLINDIKKYVDSTALQRKESDLVFVTRNGKPVTRPRLNHSFGCASIECGIQKISPEKLRLLSSLLLDKNKTK